MHTDFKKEHVSYASNVRCHCVIRLIFSLYVKEKERNYTDM